MLGNFFRLSMRLDEYYDAAPGGRRAAIAWRGPWQLLLFILTWLAMPLPAIGQVTVTLRVDHVSTAPYVERLTMTIQNAHAGNSYFRFVGDQLLPNGNGSSGFACARFSPIDDNQCVVSNVVGNLCLQDGGFPIPALCGEIPSLGPGMVSCIWEITPAIPGCASELLEVRGYSTFEGTSQFFLTRERVVRQVPAAPVPVDPGALLLLAALLLALGMARLASRH